MKKTRIGIVVLLSLCVIGFGLVALFAQPARAADCFAGPCIDGVREVCCLEYVPASPNCKKCPYSWERVCRLEACYLSRD